MQVKIRGCEYGDLIFINKSVQFHHLHDGESVTIVPPPNTTYKYDNSMSWIWRADISVGGGNITVTAGDHNGGSVKIKSGSSDYGDSGHVQIKTESSQSKGSTGSVSITVDNCNNDESRDITFYTGNSTRKN